MKHLIYVQNNQAIVLNTESGTHSVVEYPHSEITYKEITDRFTSIKWAECCPYGYNDYKNRITKFYNKIGNELGCSLRVFKHMLCGAIYKAYIKPNEDLHRRFSSVFYFKGVTRNPRIVVSVNKNSHILRQYIADGQDHVAGFGMIVGTPKKAKKVFGKGLWKNLCSNSKTRNDRICFLVLGGLFNIEERVNFVKFLNTLPSTFLYKLDVNDVYDLYSASNSSGFVDLIGKSIKYINKPLCRIEKHEIEAIKNYVYDTERMLSSIGSKFNTKWSIQRVMFEHKAAVRKLKELKASDEEFIILTPYQDTIEENKFKATLVKSAKALQAVGNKQNHCVGSYWLDVKSGNYVVYEITDEKGVVSTLGVGNPFSTVKLPTQHYYKSNGVIIDDDRVSFGKMVAEKVVKIMEENTDYTTSKQVAHTHDIIDFNNNNIPF